jgi:hypothetical protein
VGSRQRGLSNHGFANEALRHSLVHNARDPSSEAGKPATVLLESKSILKKHTRTQHHHHSSQEGGSPLKLQNAMSMSRDYYRTATEEGVGVEVPVLTFQVTPGSTQLY